MRDGRVVLTRRAATKLLLALPLAAPSAAEEKKPEEKLSPQAECLVAHETGLSPEETARLRQNVASGQKALAVIRDFKLPADVAPSLRFVAMKSRKR